MVKPRVLSPLPFWDEESVLAFLAERGVKPVHAYSLWKLALKHRPQQLGDLKELSLGSHILLPTGLVEALCERFVLTTSTVVETHVSSDGTTKLLVELQDGQRVEAVVIRHQGRNTLCVSSQVGCAMGCTFCATGTMGIKGNLMGGEILEQLYHANGVAKIRNVVFMGMGEPLQNYPSVIGAVRGMVDVRRFGLSHDHVTISTVGVVHRIRQMTQDYPNLNLALSLHAPTQELRLKIVPSAKAFPLEKLMQACYDHTAASRKALFVEYVLLKGVNDQVEHAHQLGQLLQQQNVIVNLIPYNPTDVGMDYETPDDDDVTAFHQILCAEYKLHSTVRRHHGRDINGACGQLALNRPGGEAGSSSTGGGGGAAPAVSDIEDLLLSGRRGERDGGSGGGGGGAVPGANGVVRRRMNAGSSGGGSGDGTGGTAKPRVTFSPAEGMPSKSEAAADSKGDGKPQEEEQEEKGGLLKKLVQRLPAAALSHADRTTVVLSIVAGASVAVAAGMVVALLRKTK